MFTIGRRIPTATHVVSVKVGAQAIDTFHKNQRTRINPNPAGGHTSKPLAGGKVSHRKNDSLDYTC